MVDTDDDDDIEALVWQPAPLLVVPLSTASIEIWLGDNIAAFSYGIDSVLPSALIGNKDSV